MTLGWEYLLVPLPHLRWVPSPEGEEEGTVSAPTVIPAQAGIQTLVTNGVALRRHHFSRWVPACAGMTVQI